MSPTDHNHAAHVASRVTHNQARRRRYPPANLYSLVRNWGLNGSATRLLASVVFRRSLEPKQLSPTQPHCDAAIAFGLASDI
jgi:hypothetical protein